MQGHIRQRDNGKWSLVIPIGKYANGKTKYKWSGGHRTKKEAQHELARLLNEVHTGTYVEPSRFSVAEYLSHWLNTYARPKVAARTLERYEEIVHKHLVPSLGHYPLAKLQPLHIQEYYNAAMTNGKARWQGWPFEPNRAPPPPPSEQRVEVGSPLANSQPKLRRLCERSQGQSKGDEGAG